MTLADLVPALVWFGWLLAVLVVLLLAVLQLADPLPEPEPERRPVVTVTGAGFTI